MKKEDNIIIIQLKCFWIFIEQFKVLTDEWQRVGSRRTKSGSKKATPSHQCYMILARGFQWKVTKKDVIDFFKGIHILNGEKGINIIKNVAMEAYIELASRADIKAALKLDNRKVDDRIIHSMFCSIRIDKMLSVI